MRAWSYWFPDLAPHVPGCPSIIMAHELRRTAQTFFERSRAWRIDQAPIAVATGAETVPLAPSDATLDLVELEAVWYDGRRMEPVTVEELDKSYSTNWRDQTGTPDRYLELVPGVLTIFPKPIADATEGIRMRMIVKPSDTSTGLPVDIAKRYHDAVHIGAKARLMVYPNKPWSNPQMAGVYASSFSAITDAAHASAAKGNVRARVRNNVKWC